MTAPRMGTRNMIASWRTVAWLLMTLFATACDRGAQDDKAGGLSVWAHAGQSAERLVLEQQIDRFLEANPDIEIELSFLPERTYNAQVQAAALAGDLPDILELDGPFLYNYVWQGHLQPLDAFVGDDILRDLIPSVVAQGRWHGNLYGMGTFDSGLALYARRSLLEAAGIRIPAHPRDAWSVDEFNELLASLAREDGDGAVLDLKLNYPDEWFTYAFSPILQSAGADLIDRAGYAQAGGVLNGPAAVRAMTTLQGWLTSGLVDPNLDDAAFTTGRVALSWAGHWEYPRYRDSVGADLVLVPLPDFGSGSRTGQGSWVWGLTKASGNADAAVRLLEFLLRPEEVLAMIEANGAVPATYSAISESQLYDEGGALRLFATQLTEGYAVPRPQTPGYPLITSTFRRAFADIRNGDDVQAALDRAATQIDLDIRDNDGYPFPAGP